MSRHQYTESFELLHPIFHQLLASVNSYEIHSVTFWSLSALQLLQGPHYAGWRIQAWAHKIFIFRTEKNLKFQDIFQDIRVTKKRVFLSFRAHITFFGTFRAEAKITTRRHEVVYRLSSERKMIDLE